MRLTSLARTPADGVRGTVALLVATSVLVALATPVLMRAVSRFGHNLPVLDVQGDYVFGMVFAVVLGALLFALPIRRSERGLLLILWAVKAMVVLLPMLAYESHYFGLDEYFYFGAARAGRFMGTDNGSTRMQAIVRFAYGGGLTSFRAIELTFAMVGLFGVYAFYRAAVIFVRHEMPWLLLALGVVPSILFWSSIIGKDPLVMFGVGLFALGVTGLWTRRNPAYLLPLIMGLLVASYIRVWMGAIMVSGLSFAGFSTRGHTAVKLAAGAVVLAVAVAVNGMVLNTMKVASQKELLDTLQESQHDFAAGNSQGAGKVPIGGWTDVLKFAPVGMFSALFRPFPGEVMNAFGLMAGLEDVFLLTLFGRALVRLRFSDLKDSVILGGVATLGAWAFLYGFISIGNMGTAVRYRLQVLPVMILLFGYLGRPQIPQGRSDHVSHE